MLFLEVLINYILPVIYTSFVSLVLVLFFLFVFRIKDSNIRILFFFIPLIKPFIVITEKIKFSISMKYLVGFRFPDTNNIIKTIRDIDMSSLLFSETDYLILLLLIISIIVILFIRWVILYLFYRNLAHEDRVERKDAPEIYGIIDNYTKKVKIDVPDVSLTYKRFYSPFVIGIKKVMLVMSPYLLEELSISEKETLVYHELSHIKRKDNLIGWIALILRDFLFFNPFVYIAYYLIRAEQEKGSDKLAMKYSGKPGKEIAKNILNTMLKIKNVSTLKPVSQPIQSFKFVPTGLFSQMILKNRINSISITNPSKIYSRFFPKILMCILFVFLLLFQIVFFFKINSYFIFLR